MVTNPLKVNLKRTQRGFVPLEDRFKSFPADSENMPITNFRLFYDAFANGRLERGTLDLLYPIPKWLARKLRPKGTPTIQANCLVTGDGKIILANGKCIVMNPGLVTCLTTDSGVLIVDGKCLEINSPAPVLANCLEVDGKILTIDGKCLALQGEPCLTTSQGVLLIDGKCLEMTSA